MLTIAAVKAAKPRGRAYKLFDTQGLFLYIAPTGFKSWRMKYRFGGKEKLLTIDRFPDCSLAQARADRDVARGQLRHGIDPGAAPVKTEFEPIARTWHVLKRARWSKSHAQDVISSLERDVFPDLGLKDIASIRATDVLAVIGSIEARGCIPTARRLRQRLSAIFRYAISQELADRDPASIVDQAMMPTPLVRPQKALSDIVAARDLLASVEATKAMTSIRLASRFLALTAVRLDAARGARWDELEQLDGSDPIWRVPPERMKLSRAKKMETRFSHLVPLSGAAMTVLESAARSLAGPGRFRSSGLIFPGRNPNLPIGAGAIRSLYVRVGFGGRHVPHGWRATFSTIMNEDMPAERSAIDLALAHAGKDKVEAAYNRSEMLDRRKRILDRWGKMLSD